jgi:hypothetical protein
MRKAMKLKKHSCPMCKPNKMMGACRWKVKEFQKLRNDEKEIREALKDGNYTTKNT